MRPPAAALPVGTPASSSHDGRGSRRPICVSRRWRRRSMLSHGGSHERCGDNYSAAVVARRRRSLACVHGRDVDRFFRRAPRRPARRRLAVGSRPAAPARARCLASDLSMAARHRRVGELVGAVASRLPGRRVRDRLDTDLDPAREGARGRRRETMKKRILRGALLVSGAYVLSAVAARPWMDRWGSTAEERALLLAGDELVADAEQQTHAISIDAPPEAVWPWLVQMGQGRAGFYSHDRLERFVGADIRNADEIHPEWQHLAVGDLVRTYRPIPRFEPLGWLVTSIEPPRLLVVHEPERAGIINSSWAFALRPDG